jgi:succinate dehydrogenase/fumarate reductase flavoprotein subunit
VAGSEGDIYECDALVVGSGCAGLSAAVTAGYRGLNVLIAEKEQKFGGTTAHRGGQAVAKL